MAAPRLQSFDYQGNYIYALTLCCSERRRSFIDPNKVRVALKILNEISTELKFEIWCYCFMPDHLHLLIQGKSGGANLKAFVRLYKIQTGFYLKNNGEGTFWQASYYDHVVRTEKEFHVTVRYILENPVRAGLVEKFWEYEYSGSSVFGIDPRSRLDRPS